MPQGGVAPIYKEEGVGGCEVLGNTLYTFHGPHKGPSCRYDTDTEPPNLSASLKPIPLRLSLTQWFWCPCLLGLGLVHYFGVHEVASLGCRGDRVRSLNHD